MRRLFLLFAILIVALSFSGQTGTIEGKVMYQGEVVPYAQVFLSGTTWADLTDSSGAFRMEGIPLGQYRINASFVGYERVSQPIHLTDVTPDAHITLTFEQVSTLNEVVVTGTRTQNKRSESPVLVDLLDKKAIEQVQAVHLADGLQFLPGIRVETDCQTCNYSQVRMNGLAGGYSQILINGRPLLSALAGLYGLEQVPASFIERIEVVRGGGSSLYGSSAIGGTINVITRKPVRNSAELSLGSEWLSRESSSTQYAGYGALVGKEGHSGATVYFSHFQRDPYDANADGFSEIPTVKNTSLGTQAYWVPADRHEVDLHFMYLDEYRYGGEIVDGPAHLALQSEERQHHVGMGGLDYRWHSRDDLTNVAVYAGMQRTGRTHYTGLLPEDSTELEMHLAKPPYGTSHAQTIQGGIQVNRTIESFIYGTNTLTIGCEYMDDAVEDQIDAYSYRIDQTTRDLGAFCQSHWKSDLGIAVLAGIRADRHNLMSGLVFSPRASVMYTWKKYTQFRVNWGTGFRAPQAFDSDMHIAFAAGGVSRATLSPDLQPERSQSWSASVNWDHPQEHFIVGFTIEGFYTRLNQAFVLEQVGEDEHGVVFQKRNGQGAQVRGATAEVRARVEGWIQLQGGWTFQQSFFDEAVNVIDDAPETHKFMRTPSQYGFATISSEFSENLQLSADYKFTGSMLVPHFAGAENQDNNEIIHSDVFHVLGVRAAYRVKWYRMKSALEFSVGMRNILSAYQTDFDAGMYRDSNYIYGPSAPRSVLIGIRWKVL
ncbi:MAG: TonB-dependent receptor [Flavobacteriales bacterium]|nr:TonB-dependent receptor [Flavobacteriales bacterium]